MRHRRLILAFTTLLALCTGLFAARAAAPRSAVPLPLTRPPETASYTLDVTLDPTARAVRGEGRITYTNPSQDTLSEVWLRLYLKAFSSEDTVWMRESGGAHRGFSAEESRGDITLTRLAILGGPDLLPTSTLTDTLLRAPLPTPLGPGGRLELEVAWESQLPRVFARTGYGGRDDTFFMVGQWYPRLAVYDRGRWDSEPWHANSEFFHDFGRYDVTITAPAEYLIAATGLPRGDAAAAPAGRSQRYVAEGVTDFAFAASPDFQIHSARAGSAEVLLFLMPEHAGSARRYLDVAIDSLQSFGEWFGPYPHPRLTVVDVPDDAGGAGGMEYPTLITAGTMGLPAGTGFDELVIAHEIGHQWWPMQTATNEGREPWLDEGLTEYSGIRLMEATGRRLGQGLGLSAPATDLAAYASQPAVRSDLPAWEYGGDYAMGVYNKPALGLMTLERVVGSERFRAAMAAYLAEWRFRHPTAADFRAVMERELGDLAWLFDDYIATEGQIAYSVLPLEGDTVTVERRGSVRAPAELLVRFASGREQTYPIDGARERSELALPPGDPPVSAEVDPEHKLYAEIDRRDNGAYASGRPLLTLTLGARLAFWLQMIVQTLGLIG